MNCIDVDDILRQHVRAITDHRLLTQEQIAHAGGLHRTALANWLSRRRSLSLKAASRLITLIGPARIGRELIELGQQSGPKSSDRLGKAIESHGEMRELAEELAKEVSQEPKYEIEHEHETSEYKEVI